MAKTIRWLLAIFLVTATLSGLAYTHHVLGRPDRIYAAQLEANLASVRDQIVRYEYETGCQPPDLFMLVPAYLRKDQIENEKYGTLYVYDAKQRTLREKYSLTINGLFRYQLDPRQLKIEQPEKASVEWNPPIHVACSPTPPAQDNGNKPAQENTPEVVVTPDKDSKPVARGVETGPLLELRVTTGPEGNALEALTPPEGALVFEAEHFSELNYGWEVHPDKSCSGGAYLHCKEGIANGPGQTRARVGDFYQVRGTRDVTALRYHIHIPVAGKYYVYGRMFTTDTHCSNNICIALDQGGPQIGAMGNIAPFRFLWCKMDASPQYLTKGDHFLHVFIHEDGIRLDQFIISPTPISGNEIYKNNYTPGQGTTFETATGDPALLTFDLKNSVITPSMPPVCNLVLRRLRSNAGQAHVKVKLQGANDGEDLMLAHGLLDLAKLPDLGFLPLDFSGINWEKLPRREYLLRAELSNDAGLLVTAQTVLRRPYVYEVFGPGKLLDISARGPLDQDGEPAATDHRKWMPFADKSWQELGVLDFGLHVSNNSEHPVQYQTLYARTKIKVSKAGVYLFKLQSDDQMILWLDEKDIFRQEELKPVTRNAEWLKVHLSAGEHRLRMRVNQYEGRWQATVLIRSESDEITPDVIGVP